MLERSLEMAVLGDSVLWGSGLEEEQKLWSLVRRWLEENGESVRVRVLAHALAVVERDAVKDAAPPVWGEVRYRYPSITYQALEDPRLGDDPEAIGLVLVNGGINDLGPLNLVNPWRSPRWVREQAAEHCGRKMRHLLLGLLTRLPEAQVVVTGYFPIVSAQTWFVRALPFRSLRRRLVDLSKTWAEASEAWLRWAVDQANLHGSGSRVLYAGVRFGPEHCYGAPDAYVWSLWEALTDRTPVGKRRRCECRRRKPWDLICPIDRAFHPNDKGAQAYAEAVIDALAGVPSAAR
jgi:lysophospholipase L1-like esterase